GIGFPHSSAHVRMNVGGVRIKLIIKVRPEKRAADRESYRFSLVVCYTATGKCSMHCFIA
ncbi:MULTISPECIES: hypothetical protein, partial [unclassified Collinsella]|uniref:hypothetical protein n=1 Tax=unclassified Collinsella TaxID=2637548 RepID=UPI00195AE9EB